MCTVIYIQYLPFSAVPLKKATIVLTHCNNNHVYTQEYKFTNCHKSHDMMTTEKN